MESTGSMGPCMEEEYGYLKDQPYGTHDIIQLDIVATLMRERLL